MGEPGEDRDRTDRALAREAAEATFAILTATYHDLPERDALIAELDADQRARVIRLMASYLRGAFMHAEVVARAPAGSALPTVVARMRDVDWMQ